MTTKPEAPTPSNPHVAVATGNEIAQLIANEEARKLGFDPTTHDIQFKVTYRTVKAGLVAPISVQSITPKPPHAPVLISGDAGEAERGKQ